MLRKNEYCLTKWFISKKTYLALQCCHEIYFILKSLYIFVMLSHWEILCFFCASPEYFSNAATVLSRAESHGHGLYPSTIYFELKWHPKQARGHLTFWAGHSPRGQLVLGSSRAKSQQLPIRATTLGWEIHGNLWEKSRGRAWVGGGPQHSILPHFLPTKAAVFSRWTDVYSLDTWSLYTKEIECFIP